MDQEKGKDIQSKIMVTNGVKHTVPLDEILNGEEIAAVGELRHGASTEGDHAFYSGFFSKEPPTPIDKPNFISTDEADDFLEDDEFGIGLCIKGDDEKEDCRFYPYQIIVWHYVVNDVVGGVPVAILYCSLCSMLNAFKRTVNDEIIEFGVASAMWNSSLLITDRRDDPKNQSFWSPGLGEAIKGELAGVKLKPIETNYIKYGDWKKKYPHGKVLSKDTGYKRRYGYNALGDYQTSRLVSFGAAFNDKRLHPKEFIVGIQVGNKYKAYPMSELKIGEVKDELNGETILINKDETGEIRITYENGIQIPKVQCFWLWWISAHPDTELYQSVS